ncbi:hypothetical protein ACB094_08G065800 [Castanea mollissima]
MVQYDVPNATWVCEPRLNASSRGIFFGDNPFDFAFPTGIAMGPSILGKFSALAATIYPRQSLYLSKTLGNFACLLFMFLVGVKMDLSMVTKSGKKAFVIGLCAFLLPLTLSTTFASILKHNVTLEQNLYKSLIPIAVFQSTSSFHVITCLLADLNLLNSELGRLATSSSMVSGICSWIWLMMSLMVRQSSISKKNTISLQLLSLKGKYSKESYINFIFLMILICALLSEVNGIHFMLGPMILGLAVPDGWPLGSAIVGKLDSYVSSILLPSYFVYSCAAIDLGLINLKTTGIVAMLALCSLLGKFMGTMLPSFYYKMPVIDSFCLGLIMSSQGITDMLILQNGILLFIIDIESFNSLIITIVLMTQTLTPIVKLLYKPSKRYMGVNRRSIQHTMANEELRLLACIFHQNSTPSIINLLEVSHPMLRSPICFYVVHLMELLGRSSPILVAHQKGKRSSIHSHQSDHIINAFRLYEQHRRGKAMVHPFTAIAPYATMHDEICNLAFEKRVSMVIIPFHKRWTLHGSEECDNPIKAVNFKILKNAPCSVGILVDKGTLSGKNSGSSKPLYSIGMIFVGGPDDREALTYAMHMAEHPKVSLTVIRLVQPHKKSNELDFDMIKRFKMPNTHQKHCLYREEVVKNSVEIINVIKSIENLYELILVGRQHESNSPLFMGLTLCNEYPELGYLGDMLVSSESDWKVSVLVVQQ